MTEKTNLRPPPHPLTYKLVMTEFHDRGEHTAIVRFFLPFEPSMLVQTKINGGRGGPPISILSTFLCRAFQARSVHFVTISENDGGMRQHIHHSGDEKTNLIMVEWKNTEDRKTEFIPPAMLLANLMGKYEHDFLSKIQRQYEEFLLLLPKYLKAYSLAHFSKDKVRQEVKASINWDKRVQELEALTKALAKELEDEVSRRMESDPALALKKKLQSIEWPVRADEIKVVTDLIVDD